MTGCSQPKGEDSRQTEGTVGSKSAREDVEENRRKALNGRKRQEIPRRGRQAIRAAEREAVTSRREMGESRDAAGSEQVNAGAHSRARTQTSARKSTEVAPAARKKLDAESE